MVVMWLHSFLSFLVFHILITKDPNTIQFSRSYEMKTTILITKESIDKLMFMKKPKNEETTSVTLGIFFFIFRFITFNYQKI
jgi:hypothetical protein